MGFGVNYCYYSGWFRLLLVIFVRNGSLKTTLGPPLGKGNQVLELHLGFPSAVVGLRRCFSSHSVTCINGYAAWINDLLVRESPVCGANPELQWGGGSFKIYQKCQAAAALEQG
jgi:hypothetical protein